MLSHPPPSSPLCSLTPASNGRLLLIAIVSLLVWSYGSFLLNQWLGEPMPPPRLLTDPFLQQPTPTSVQVVWFTEFEGSRHQVEYGDEFRQTAEATTSQLSRTREDAQSRVGKQVEDGQVYTAPTRRPIWRHEATIAALPPGIRLPYRVVSTRTDGQSVTSDVFHLRAAPPPGTPLTILLTSDHQLKAMTPANLEQVVATVKQAGKQVDAIFFAGDLVDIPDRASEWFDDNRGRAFFPSLQGRAAAKLTYDGVSTHYRGGALIQSAPLFPAIGNHEVMGRFSMERPLAEQFNDPWPRAIAQSLLDAAPPHPTDSHSTPAAPVTAAPDSKAAPDLTDSTALKNLSFNTDTYEEIFSVPTNPTGTDHYYAVTFGDVRLISLFVANIWRSPSLEADSRGRYRERDQDLADPTRWGYGQHIFESIAPGSPQYEWLVAELNRPEFQQARYKIVMFHHPPHSLGDNIVPAYTDPQQFIDRFPNSEIKAIRYEYPLDADYLIRDITPLLEKADVQLVFYGHSHVWNRFVSPGGMHFLESSNVGNTYGAYTYGNGKRRPIPIAFAETYAAMGDPNGLEPVLPTLRPSLSEQESPQPYIASNEVTVFSLLDTETGHVSSYAFDTRQPQIPAAKFDEFQLGQPPDVRSSLP